MNREFSMLLFSDSVRLKVLEMKSMEKKKLQALQNELKSLEAEDSGTLHWRCRKGTYLFWKYKDGKQYGITRKPDKLYSLARLTYLRLLLSDTQKQNRKKWAESIESFVRVLKDAGLDFRRIIWTREQYQWAAHPQSAKRNRTEDLKFKTNGGVFVRSKSEQFIGNLLEELGIPYRYEPELFIGSRAFHPDFVIMTVDGRKIILEHFGRMDSRDYTLAAVDRLSAYCSNNLVIGRDVFVSFEQNVRSRDSLMPIIHGILAA